MSFSFSVFFACLCIWLLQRQLSYVHSDAFFRGSVHQLFIFNSCLSFFDSFFGFAFFCRAMDLLVPCIVEGRSELRNHSRVNCKTHSVFGLQNTLLTERIKHLIDHVGWWVCLAESILSILTHIFHVLLLFSFFWLVFKWAWRLTCLSVVLTWEMTDEGLRWILILLWSVKYCLERMHD